MPQQESNYSIVFKKNPLAMIIIDKDSYEFLDVNPAVTSIFGYDADTLLTMTFMDMVPEEDHDDIKKQLEKVTEDKDIDLYVKNIKKNGDKIDMHITATQINFKGKQCILKIATDITEVYFKKLFNSSPFAIVFLNEEEKIVNANEAFRDLFKYKAEELTDKELGEVIIPKDYISENKELVQKVKNGEFARIETKRKNKDEELIDVLKVKFPVMLEGKFKGSFSIYLDITEEKKLDKEVKELQKELENRVDERTKELQQAYNRLQELNFELEEINKSKDKLISIISHDLRNPLSAITSSSEIIVGNPESLDKEELKAFIRIINNSSKKIANQLDELVEWSKQKIKKIDLKSLNLYDFVEVSIELIEENAKEKNIKIKNEIDKNIRVHADTLLLRSIFQNLITNSIKFTPKGGGIKISAFKKDESFIEISIKDTGIGMPEEVASNLFTDPYVLTKSGEETGKPKGLGLILVKDFVKKHKGEIWVESEPGKGTTFHFTMPSD